MSDQPIVHVGTQIIATFGRVDEEGNVIPCPQPFRFTLVRLDERAFDELRWAINGARVQLEAQLIGPPLPVEDPDAEAESAAI